MPDAFVNNIRFMSGHQITPVEPARYENGADRFAYLLRSNKALFAAPLISLLVPRINNDDSSSLPFRKGAARVIGEGVRHEGDLSSAGAVIISE